MVVCGYFAVYHPLWEQLLWFVVTLWSVNLCRLFNAKAIHGEQPWWFYLTHIWNKKGNTFLWGSNPKVNVIVQLELELTYKDVAVKNVGHYDTGTPIKLLLDLHKDL